MISLPASLSLQPTASSPPACRLVPGSLVWSGLIRTSRGIRFILCISFSCLSLGLCPPHRFVLLLLSLPPSLQSSFFHSSLCISLFLSTSRRCNAVRSHPASSSSQNAAARADTTSSSALSQISDNERLPLIIILIHICPWLLSLPPHDCLSALLTLYSALHLPSASGPGEL